MKFRNKHNNNEENFWLSATDLMAGILITVLLMLVLFLLYLNMSKDEVFTPKVASPDTAQYVTYRNNYESHPAHYVTIPTTQTPTRGRNSNSHQGNTEPQTEPHTEPTTTETGDQIYDRSAVFVTVVDADSGNTIKKSGTHISDKLTAGKYYVQRFENEDSRITVNLKDTSQLQRADMLVWDNIDLFAVLMAGGIIVAAVLVFGLLIKRREKVSRKNEK